MSIYTEHGYKDRADYLGYLAEDYGVDLNTVHVLAATLGEVEDFDGLIVALEDAAELEW